MKNAVVALTRGYPNNLELYNTLIKRNNSIHKRINKLRKEPVDIVLFHEGNISKFDQNYINSQSKDEIKFVNVSQYFKNTDIQLKENKKYTLGYRQMCRFNMFHIWEEVSDYDYILRIDEDSELLNIDPYIFEYMNKHEIVFITGRFSKEIHRLTNKTLPQFLINNTSINVKKIYNHKFPYTNLYATSVKFWKENDVNKILEKIAMSDEQIVNRWGDIPVLGGMLNYKNIKIKLFPKLEYVHISHNLKIKNSFLRNIFINSKFMPISVKEGLYTKIKIKIKSKFKAGNIYDFESN